MITLAAQCGTPATVVVTQEVEKEVLVTPTPEARPFEGVEVNILTLTGPYIAEPLQRRGPDFGALTGAKINVIEVPFNELYQEILTDMASGTNRFDEIGRASCRERV